MYIYYIHSYLSVHCLDVQKPPEVCYNGDGIMVMTSREITHFSSDIPAFILSATVFICEEFHKIVCGDGFWLCCEWGQDQQNKHPTLFPPILALINYKMCSHVEHYLRKLVLHAICPTSSGSEMPPCVLGQLM